MHKVMAGPFVTHVVSPYHLVIHNGEVPMHWQSFVREIVEKAGNRFSTKMFTFHIIERLDGKIDVRLSVSGSPSKTSSSAVLEKNLKTFKLKEFPQIASFKAHPFVTPAHTVSASSSINTITDTDQLRMLAFFMIVASVDLGNGGQRFIAHLPQLEPQIRCLIDIFKSDVFAAVYAQFRSEKSGSLQIVMSEKHVPEWYQFSTEKSLPISVMRGKDYMPDATGHLNGQLCINWTTQVPPEERATHGFDREQADNDPLEKWIFILKSFSKDRSLLFLSAFDVLLSEATAKNNVPWIEFLVTGKSLIETKFAKASHGFEAKLGSDKFAACQLAVEGLLDWFPSLSVDALVEHVHFFRQCGEDNLIAALRINHEAKLPGQHTVFSIKPDESLTKIAPPCDKCKISFSESFKNRCQATLFQA